MSSYLIIDGYNLINKWPSLIKAQKKSMELARSELFHFVQAYCDYNEAKAVIVYDGREERRSVKKGNPKVIFSRKGETADSVIEAMVYNLVGTADVRVATDDRIQGNLVTGMGAFTISASMLEKETKRAIEAVREIIEDRESNINKGIDL